MINWPHKLRLRFGLERKGKLADEIQNKPLDDELLTRWLINWDVVRRAPEKKREELCKFLNDAKLKLTALPTDYKLVETLRDQALDKGIFRGRETSLMSKFAFRVAPRRSRPMTIMGASVCVNSVIIFPTTNTRFIWRRSLS